MALHVRHSRLKASPGPFSLGYTWGKRKTQGTHHCVGLQVLRFEEVRLFPSTFQSLSVFVTLCVGFFFSCKSEDYREMQLCQNQSLSTKF